MPVIRKGPKQRPPSYDLIIYDENTLEEEADGNNISNVTAMANELAGLSANSNSPLQVNDDGDELTFKGSSNITALKIEYQPTPRGPFADKNPAVPKPRTMVCVPNLNKIDSKILQTFYANNRGKLRVKCKFADTEDIVKLFHNLFKDGRMDFDYTTSKELLEKEKEIKEIINALEYYEDNPNSAPPPKLLT